MCFGHEGLGILTIIQGLCVGSFSSSTLPREQVAFTDGFRNSVLMTFMEVFGDIPQDEDPELGFDLDGLKRRQLHVLVILNCG